MISLLKIIILRNYFWVNEYTDKRKTIGNLDKIYFDDNRDVNGYFKLKDSKCTSICHCLKMTYLNHIEIKKPNFKRLF